MDQIPDQVLWAATSISGGIFLISAQQLCIAPEIESTREVLLLRVIVTFALFMELCLPVIELVVRCVLMVDPIINMVPVLTLWALMLSLSFLLYKSIRTPATYEKREWAIVLRRIWIILSITNLFGMAICFVVYVLFPNQRILSINLYYIGFNLYVVCAAAATILIAYRIYYAIVVSSMTIRMASLSKDHDNQHGSGDDNGHLPKMSTSPSNEPFKQNEFNDEHGDERTVGSAGSGATSTQSTKVTGSSTRAVPSRLDSSATLAKLDSAKRMVTASVIVAITLMLLAISSIVIVSLTLTTIGPIHTMHTFLLQFALCSIFALSVIVEHWYQPANSKVLYLIKACTISTVSICNPKRCLCGRTTPSLSNSRSGTSDGAMTDSNTAQSGQSGTATNTKMSSKQHNPNQSSSHHSNIKVVVGMDGHQGRSGVGADSKGAKSAETNTTRNTATTTGTNTRNYQMNEMTINVVPPVHASSERSDPNVPHKLPANQMMPATSHQIQTPQTNNSMYSPDILITPQTAGTLTSSPTSLAIPVNHRISRYSLKSTIGYSSHKPSDCHEVSMISSFDASLQDMHSHAKPGLMSDPTFTLMSHTAQPDGIAVLVPMDVSLNKINSNGRFIGNRGMASPQRIRESQKQKWQNSKRGTDKKPDGFVYTEEYDADRRESILQCIEEERKVSVW